MSLALKAAEAANAARSNDRSKAQAQAAERDEKYLATFISRTGFEGAKSLGCKQVDVLREIGDQWSRRWSRETRTWFYVEYDDVVFINETKGGALDYSWNVQKACSMCNRLTRAGTSTYATGFGLPQISDDAAAQAKARDSLVTSIGMWLTAKTVCTECLAGIPAQCPTCLRGN